MPEPRDPAPGNEDLSAFGGEGAFVHPTAGIDERAGANSETATPRPSRQESAPAGGRGNGAAETARRRQDAAASQAGNRSASPTNGQGPVDNFLNKVTLGTYKFTFYIVDSDVWNDPRQWLGTTDEAALAGGKACIIAESGVEGAFVIENVVILTEAANARTGNADIRQITFEILEPLGFSLLDRILTVGKELKRENPAGTNLPSQLYVLKLEFLGRDPLTGSTRKYEENFLYRGAITGVNGTIGAAGARYFISYEPTEMIALRESQTQTDITVRNVTTVAQFVSNLEVALNEHQRSLMVPVQTKPYIEWVVRLGDRTNIEARDHLRVPAFNLADAPWGGSADSSTSAGQAQMLADATGGRQITLTGESQIIAHIQQQIGSNTPTFAEWLTEARTHGVSESIRVIQEVEDLDEQDPAFNTPRKRVTITINLQADPTIPPLEPENVEQLRNVRTVQEERFDNEIFPYLVKKYSYLYTGENTEVIDINLELNHLFMNAQSPAAGIYYANNHNQFEPNIIQREETTDTANPNASSSSTQESHASARYLSDITLNKYNILQSSVFGNVQRGPQTQQRNETTTTDTIAAAAIEEYARRIGDTQTLTIQVRGDPIFMGQTGSGNNLFDGSGSAVFMAFINYQPDPEDLLLNQRRGPVDMVTTGIYKVTSIESKFQMGSFTQTIIGIRDSNSTTFHLLQKIIELDLR